MSNALRIHATLLGFACFWIAGSAMGQIPSFPGAEGYGSAAAGGRGGDVYVVTNLNASGTGSFFDAIKNVPTAGRTIVFAVSGHIRVPSGSGGTTVSANRLTIAGQTAPGDGICLWNNTINFSGDDVVVRHLRFRYGKQTAGGDAVDINGSQRLLFDHCDHMFSTDENLSSFGTPPEYFTYQWSINAWGLQTHSAGGLWDIDHATAHHTLWANNHTRNPKCIAPSVFDWANNVVFGWNNGFNMAESPAGGTGYTHRVNVRGSTFVHGASTSEAIYGGGTNTDATNKFKLHMSDTALDGNTNGMLDVSRTNYQLVSSGASYDQTASAWPQTVNGIAGGTAIGTAVTLDARLTAYKKVLSQAGALRLEYDAARPLRDEITQLCVTRVAAQQRGIITDPLELGLSTGTAFAALNSASPPTDTDGDGMPDHWESAVGLSTTTADNNTVLTAPQIAASFFPAGTPTGYTRLEEYLHFKSVPHGALGKNTALTPSFIDVDLSRYTSGFTASPVFTVSGIVGGTVSQSGTGGKTVRFTPTLDTFGRAGFLFTVTDAEGSTWTQQFCLLVLQTTPPRALTWTGDGVTNNWDTTTSHWTDAAGVTTFANGDAVTINDSGSNSPTIKLIGALQPASVAVDASAKNFTLTGAGSLTGIATLSKTGAGTLTLSNTTANTIGKVQLDGGTLTTGAGGTLGAAALAVTNATLNLGGDTSGPFTLNGTLNLNPVGSRSFNGAWSGSGIVNITTSNLLTLGGSMTAFTGEVNFGTSSGSARLYGSLGCATASWDLGTSNFTLLNRNGGSSFVLGELSGGPATSLIGASAVTTATLYTIGGMNTSSTFAGSIKNNTGTTAITKVGTGTLTLTGSSTHTGATTVSAGELALDGSFGASAVTVASGARLSGTGSFGGGVAMSAGSSIAPGGDSAGTLTAASLSLTSPTLEFDLSATPGGANDLIVVNGPVTLTNAQTFVFQFTAGGVDDGTYHLITSPAAITGSNVTFAANFPTGTRQTFTLERSADGVSPGFVRLVVTGNNANLTWTGTNGALWDVQNTSAWSGSTPATFFNSDFVTFNDSADTGNVGIAQSVAPRSITVDNSTLAYAFSGSAITGSTSLIKNGTGTLTLNAANTFTGGTVVNAGTLALGNATANASALGSGTVTLNGGVLRMYSAGNGTHAGTMPNKLVVAGNARFEVAPRCGISGAVSGAGTLEYHTNYVRPDISGDWSAFTGQINVTTAGSGEFRITANYSWPGLPAASVNLAAGTYFNMAGIVNSGAGTTITIGTLSGASGSFLRGGPTGDRTLTYRIGGKNEDAVFAGRIVEQGATTITDIIKTGGAVWTLSAACSHRGVTTVESGTLRLTSTASISQSSELSVQSGATLDLQGATVTAGGISLAEGSTFNYSGGTLIGEASLGGDLNVNITSGTSFTLIQNNAGTPVSGTFNAKPEGTLIQTNGQIFRLSYLGGDGNDVTLTVHTVLNGAEQWRLTHFGTTANSGIAADDYDADFDGENNLLEFATGQNPHAATHAVKPLETAGGNLDFRYTRNIAALAEGLTFTVQWSDSLAPNSWSSLGVTDLPDPDDPGSSDVENRVATLPAGSGSQRFVRLKVSQP